MPKVEQVSSGGGRGRRGRSQRVSSSLAEINVVPLVDVMLVLLIIFMVSAPMMQQGFTVALPQARRAQPVNAEPIYIQVPLSFTRDSRVLIDKEPVRLELLAERTRQVLEGRTTQDVYVGADGQLPYQAVVTVMDALRAGGVRTAALVNVPASGRR